MKYAMMIVLLVMSASVEAGNDYGKKYNQEKHKSQAQHITANNQQTSQSAAGAVAGSKAVAASGSHSAGGNSNISDESVTTLVNRWEPAAASAASISVTDCMEGMSGQATDGGFSVSNPAQPCINRDALQLLGQKMLDDIARAKTYRQMARECPDKPELQQEYYNEAYAIMQQVEADGQRKGMFIGQIVEDAEDTQAWAKIASMAWFGIKIAAAAGGIVWLVSLPF